MSSSVSPWSTGEILRSPNLTSFTYKELGAATMDFAPENMLGEGGFGKVFKGYVDLTTFAPASSDTGVPIAVKKLNQGAHQGHKEWLVSTRYQLIANTESISSIACQ
jgi:hypothetical protein